MKNSSFAYLVIALKLIAFAAIFSILAYAYVITNEALEDKAYWEAKFAEQRAIKLPKYSMDYETVEMENGKIRQEVGHVIARDSTVWISTSGWITGTWAEPDIFVDQDGHYTVFFDEEKVTVIQNIENPTGKRKQYVDIYIRSK